MEDFPSLFIERFKKIFPHSSADSIYGSFVNEKVLSVRVNTIKMKRDDLIKILRERDIRFQSLSWFADVFLLISAGPIEDLIDKGLIYVQNPSSVLVALILDPQPGENILDMCAAPGSKATLMAALMNNEGRVRCLENIRKRFYKLRSVVQCLGAANIDIRLIDGRRYNVKSPDDFFDRILVDASCSCEGRFRVSDKKSYAYWSLRKIKEMAHKQKGLLLNAARLLKPGGTLVYSTCTLAPEENEAVIDWVLRKTKGPHKDQSRWHLELVPVTLEQVKTYPVVLEWEKRIFDPNIRHCRRILPDEVMDAFFVAKLMKIEDER